MNTMHVINMNETIFRNAKEIGGRKFADIPVHALKIDAHYQRPINDTGRLHIENMAKNWSNEKCDPLRVSYRGGSFYIVDGQHRYYAAQKAGVDFLVCEIMSNTSSQAEAVIFAQQNENKTVLRPYNLYRAWKHASSEIHNPQTDAAQHVADVCGQYNLAVVPDARGRKFGGAISCVTDLMRFACLPGGLEWGMDLLYNAGWTASYGGLSKSIVSALRRVYQEFKPHSGDETSEALLSLLTAYTPNALDCSSRSYYPSASTKAARFYLALRDCVTGVTAKASQNIA